VLSNSTDGIMGKRFRRHENISLAGQEKQGDGGAQSADRIGAVAGSSTCRVACGGEMRVRMVRMD